MRLSTQIKRFAATPLRRGPLADYRRRRRMSEGVAAAGQAAEMSFAEAVEGRGSVRHYLPDPVPREDARRMVALATRAASAGNKQMWRFVAVEDVAVRQQLADAVTAKLDEMAAWPETAGLQQQVKAIRGYNTFFVDAPLVFAVAAQPYHARVDDLLEARGIEQPEYDRLRQRADLQSVGGAIQLLITAAHALGYGACWMTAPVIAAEEIERVLDIEPPARLIALVPVGRPARPLRRSTRVPLDEVLRFV
jgi:nitroreductase